MPWQLWSSRREECWGAVCVFDRSLAPVLRNFLIAFYWLYSWNFVFAVALSFSYEIAALQSHGLSPAKTSLMSQFPFLSLLHACSSPPFNLPFPAARSCGGVSKEWKKGRGERSSTQLNYTSKHLCWGHHRREAGRSWRGRRDWGRKGFHACLRGGLGDSCWCQCLQLAGGKQT